jgi:hypothetical protein
MREHIDRSNAVHGVAAAPHFRQDATIVIERTSIRPDRDV